MNESVKSKLFWCCITVVVLCGFYQTGYRFMNLDMTATRAFVNNWYIFIVEVPAIIYLAYYWRTKKNGSILSL